MKVTGPGQSSGAPDATPDAGVDPTGAGESTMPAGATGAVERGAETFADKLDKLETSGKPAAAPQLDPAHRMTADLAAELRPGTAGAREALARIMEKVLDRVVDGQVGPDAPPAVRETLRSALRDTLENDPLLAEKLRQLQDA